MRIAVLGPGHIGATVGRLWHVVVRARLAAQTWVSAAKGTSQ